MLQTELLTKNKKEPHTTERKTFQYISWNCVGKIYFFKHTSPGHPIRGTSSICLTAGETYSLKLQTEGMPAASSLSRQTSALSGIAEGKSQKSKKNQGQDSNTTKIFGVRLNKHFVWLQHQQKTMQTNQDLCLFPVLLSTSFLIWKTLKLL